MFDHQGWTKTFRLRKQTSGKPEEGLLLSASTLKCCWLIWQSGDCRSLLFRHHVSWGSLHGRRDRYRQLKTESVPSWEPEYRSETEFNLWGPVFNGNMTQIITTQGQISKVARRAKHSLKLCFCSWVGVHVERLLLHSRYSHRLFPDCSSFISPAQTSAFHLFIKAALHQFLFFFLVQAMLHHFLYSALVCILWLLWNCILVFMVFLARKSMKRLSRNSEKP